MSTKTFFYFIFHFILAFIPLIFSRIFGAHLRTDWYVIPILIVNGCVQGGAFVYRIYIQRQNSKNVLIAGLRMQISGQQMMINAANESVKSAINIRKTILDEIQRQWNEEPKITKAKSLDKIINLLNHNDNVGNKT
jgi:uncharacterized membrane protein